MIFSPPLQRAILLRRYKRFLADIRLPDGAEITVHCANTGSMKNCAPPGAAVLYSDSGNPARKYRHTLEAVQVAHGHWVGVNTARPNALVAEALQARRVPELADFDRLTREVRFADSRFDIALSHRAAGDTCADTDPVPMTYVEVKSVTLGGADDEPDEGVVAFPDAVSERGQKHLRTLMQVAKEGHRAVLFFCVQHTGATMMRPADEIDPRYGALLREAAQSGVTVLAWKTSVTATEFSLQEPIPLLL